MTLACATSLLMAALPCFLARLIAGKFLYSDDAALFFLLLLPSLLLLLLPSLLPLPLEALEEAAPLSSCVRTRVANNAKKPLYSSSCFISGSGVRVARIASAKASNLFLFHLLPTRKRSRLCDKASELKKDSARAPNVSQPTSLRGRR